MRVSVVIPNWNGKLLLEKHLKKVIDASRGSQIIVADDGSTDGSVEFIKKKFPSVTVVGKSKREGFASTVNAGVAVTTSDIVVLLNSDVVPEPGFLEPLLIDFKDPAVFAVGCLEISHEENKEVLRGRGLGKWVKGFYLHRRGTVKGSDTAWVSGGSGAFRKSMWIELGGMDTLYNPFYWEDIDLSYRARKAGWKIVFEPKSIIHHYHEEGKIKKEFAVSDIQRIAYRNQFIFIWKNATDAGLLLTHAMWTPIRLLQSVLRGDFYMIPGYITAIWKLPVILIHKASQTGIFRVSDHDIVTWDYYG